MAKKHALLPDTETENEVAVNEAESPEAEKVPAKAERKEVTCVDMQDGTKITFGSRQNVITDYDYNTGDVTFKLISGTVINWKRPEVAEFTNEFVRKVYMFGILQKVKQSLAGVKVDELEKTLREAMASIDKGEFSIRTGLGDSSPTLGETQIAFARAKFKNFPDTIPAGEDWSDLENPTTIANVLNFWTALSKEQKAKVLKNVHVQQELLAIKIANSKFHEETL